MNDILHSETIQIRGREYRIDIKEFWFDRSLCWAAYRRDKFGLWEKIHLMSRRDCERFPKSVGIMADNILLRFEKDRHQQLVVIQTNS